MNKNSSRFSRHQYRHRYVVPRRQPSDDSVSPNSEKVFMIKLRRRRAESEFACYDNSEEHNNKPRQSNWTIVRQRLPDILALSKTYRPSGIQSHLVLLVALMNKQTNQLHRLSSDVNNNNNNNDLPNIPPSVVINIGGRSRLINLKHIPSEQVIQVDIDGLSFSVPTRQFIVAISRGQGHEAAAKYCPPAITDMLINLSKSKVLDEGKQYKRALFKIRIGQFLFFIIFTLIIGMLFALIISSATTLFKLSSLSHMTAPYSTISLSSRTKIEEHREWG